MQRVDLLATLPLTLVANLMGQRQRQGEGVTEGGVVDDLAPDIADNAAQEGSDRRKALFALELFRMGVALVLDQGELANPRIGLGGA